jgi:hypothetical protein
VKREKEENGEKKKKSAQRTPRFGVFAAAAERFQ